MTKRKKKIKQKNQQKRHLKMILVSACLLGYNYRYNGSNCLKQELLDLLSTRDIKAICPEIEGGLKVPRLQAEIINGDGYDVLAKTAQVINTKGEDLSPNYLLACQKMLRDINLDKIEFAVLKTKSPACGFKRIYSGEFNGQLQAGVGVAAAFLQQKGIKIYTEEDIEEIKKELKS